MKIQVLPEIAYESWLGQSRLRGAAPTTTVMPEHSMQALHFDVENLYQDEETAESPGFDLTVDDSESLRSVLSRVVQRISPTLHPSYHTTVLLRVWSVIFLLMGTFSLYSLLHPSSPTVPTWMNISTVILSLAFFVLNILARSPFPGYVFDFPSLAITYDDGRSKRSLRNLGFYDGDVIVVRRDPGVPGAMGFWGHLVRNPLFWTDRLDQFLWHAISVDRPYNIYERAMDSHRRPTPPCVGGVVLYTDEDWAIARYIRQNFASLHFMSGLLLTLYVFEEKPPQTGDLAFKVRKFWAERLPKKWFRVWSALQMTASKPYSSEAVYHFCNQMDVAPDLLPCVLLFRDWKNVMTERELIPIDGELEMFFRRLCGDVRQAVLSVQPGDIESAVVSKQFWHHFSQRWRTRSTCQTGLIRDLPWRGADMPSVFLCHSSADKAFVHKLARDLRLAGVEIWLDALEIKVGDSLIENIQDGIGASDYLAIVLSPDAISSDWVKRELNAALMKEMEEKRVVVLPVLYRQTTIPLLLREKLYADFSESYETGLEVLLAALKRRR